MVHADGFRAFTVDFASGSYRVPAGCATEVWVAKTSRSGLGFRVRVYGLRLRVFAGNNRHSISLYCFAPVFGRAYICV